MPQVRTHLHSIPCRPTHGALLIEALIAMAVFSVGLLAILGIIARMQVHSGDARYRVEAAQYADSLLAEMRLADPATRATAYGPDGTRFTAWKTRITAAGALPQSGADRGTPPLTISFDGNNVTLRITWRGVQDKDQNASGTALSHQYVLTSSL